MNAAELVAALRAIDCPGPAAWEDKCPCWLAAIAADRIEAVLALLDNCQRHNATLWESQVHAALNEHPEAE